MTDEAHKFVNFSIFVLQWNLDLTNCQGTKEMRSLNRGSFPYYNFSMLNKVK